MEEISPDFEAELHGEVREEEEVGSRLWNCGWSEIGVGAESLHHVR